MPRITDTRPRMIRTAARLMRRQGYAATGWRQVVADSATPWGSQFHHFPGGKEQLAAEAIALAGHRYEQMLRAPCTSATRPMPSRLGRARRGRTRGERLGRRLPRRHRRTRDRAHLGCACPGMPGSARQLAHRHHRGDHGTRSRQCRRLRLASLVLASIEGGLLLARAYRSSEPLRAVGDELTAVLHARIPDARRP